MQVSQAISFSVVVSYDIAKGKNMIKSLSFVVLICLAAPVLGQSIDIATCRNPSGTTYRHYSGNNDKNASGWSEERISNGLISLTKDAAGKFDLLFVDTRKKPISMIQEGAKIVLLRTGPAEISLLVHYEGATTEIYSFFREKDGRSRYSVLTSRLGPSAISAKSSVMVGDCDPIFFDQN